MSNRRQFGSLRKLPSGRWQASYWHLGIRHIASVTFAFKADANVYLSSVETEVRRGLWIDPLGATVLFSDWAEQWRATTVDLRPSSRTRSGIPAAVPAPSVRNDGAGRHQVDDGANVDLRVQHERTGSLDRHEGGPVDVEDHALRRPGRPRDIVAL